MADVLSDFLLDCGLKPIGPVGQLESAMQLVRERALDGAILDINLNGRRRFPVCTILSARRIPFLFFSGYSAAAIPIECRGVPLVTKPFEPNEMKEVLAQMLGFRRAGRYPAISHPVSGTDAKAALMNGVYVPTALIPQAKADSAADCLFISETFPLD
jgi:CheY-like chemotaxis protein